MALTPFRTHEPWERARTARGRPSRITRMEPRERAGARDGARASLAKFPHCASRWREGNLREILGILSRPRVFLAPSGFPHALGFSSHPRVFLAPSGFLRALEISSYITSYIKLKNIFINTFYIKLKKYFYKYFLHKIKKIFL